MTFRADDLAPLLAPGGQPDIGFHSGRVLSWDVDTGANSISVAGAVLTNVPVLNTSEAVALRGGDVVGLLRFKSSYFILGRIAVPGSSVFASSSVAFAAAGHSELGVPVNLTQAVRSSVSLYGPSWATQAVLFTTVIATAANNRAVDDLMYVQPQFDGEFWGTANPQYARAGETVTVSAAQTALVSHSDFSTQPIVCECKAWALGGNWGATTGVAQVHSFAIFRGR